MKAFCIRALVALVLLATQTPLAAHHSWPVSRQRLVTVKGTVASFDWKNPHPMMTVEVRTEDGNTETWQIGGPAIHRMEAKGWTKDTVKPGDTITGIGYQFADGQKIVRLERVVLADGKELLVYARR